MRTKNANTVSDTELAERRRQVLEITLGLLNQMDYATLDLDRIAQTANYTRRALYRCFPSKTELLLTLFMKRNALWCRQLLDAMTNYREERLRQLLIRYLRQQHGFLQLLGVARPVLMPALAPATQKRYADQLDDMVTHTGSQLDQRVDFFVPGDGAAFITTTGAVLAVVHTNTTHPDPPEWASRQVLFGIGGMQRQAAARLAANKAGHPDRWGRANT